MLFALAVAICGTVGAICAAVAIKTQSPVVGAIGSVLLIVYIILALRD